MKQGLSVQFQSRSFWGRLLSPETAVTAFSFLLADLVDKPLWVLGVISDGRFIGHTLLVAFLVAAAFYLQKPAYGWFALCGGLAHRLLDIGGYMPWLYPFKQYDWPTYDYHKVVTWYNVAETLLEMAIVVIFVSVAVALVLSFFSRVRKSEAGQG